MAQTPIEQLREREDKIREQAAELARTKRERTLQAEFAIRAEDRANVYQAERGKLIEMINHLLDCYIVEAACPNSIHHEALKYRIRTGE